MTTEGDVLKFHDGHGQWQPGGGGVDYVQAADPGAVGAGKIWLQLANDFVALFPHWRANTSYMVRQGGVGDAVSPTTAVSTDNGPMFVAIASSGADPTIGVSGGAEPVWLTDGSNVVDGEITWQYQGIAPYGSGFRLYVRNAADTNWRRVGFGFRDNVAATGFAPNNIFDYYDAFRGTGTSEFQPNAGFLYMRNRRPGAADFTGLRLWPTKIEFGTGDPSFVSRQVDGFTVTWRHDTGTADPTAAGGIAAPPGSLYSRNNAGVGELWVKTGVANTAWTKVV